MSRIEDQLRRFDIHKPSQNREIHGTNYIKTTKYTPYSFIPLSIFNQYKRLANCYFLMLSLISLIPDVSPWDPSTQITPTLFVLMVAVIRDGVEDWFRYRSDS
jgi:hypothetical protein